MNAQSEIKKLNRKILSKVENELLILKENHPSLSKDVDDVYKRLRKGILDDIGDTERLLTNGASN